MKSYIVEENLVQSILNYLAKRPFIEVFGLIQRLQNIEEHKKENETEDGKDDKK